MHSDESLTLINRDGPDDSTEADFRRSEKTLTAELRAAARAGDGSPGAARAAAAGAWYGAHARVLAANRDGDYAGAVRLAISTSTRAFLRLDAALTAGIGADQAASARQAGRGDGALGGLTAGMIIAAVLMGACCVAGVGRHIAGYR